MGTTQSSQILIQPQTLQNKKQSTQTACHTDSVNQLHQKPQKSCRFWYLQAMQPTRVSFFLSHAARYLEIIPCTWEIMPRKNIPRRPQLKRRQEVEARHKGPGRNRHVQVSELAQKNEQIDKYGKGMSNMAAIHGKTDTKPSDETVCPGPMAANVGKNPLGRAADMAVTALTWRAFIKAENLACPSKDQRRGFPSRWSHLSTMHRKLGQ